MFFTQFSLRNAVLLIAVLSVANSVFAIDPKTDVATLSGHDAANGQIAALIHSREFKVELFACEPQLANPVAICLDEQGRVYVAEEYRFNRGTEENRTRPFLLEDDLQISSTADRLRMFQKHQDQFEGGMEWFQQYTDQVRQLVDSDRDGKADRSTIFSTGYNGILDGMAAGIIARDGDVYLTNIPKLYRLRDQDDDGVAEDKVALLDGFGVNAGFLGHDLHGLAWGPDGRLYFSIGDRGYNVTNKEGKNWALPRRGAVFRCEPDGSKFEVVHIGLRNPQELAFDEFGNLFAADNNCDKGDDSRLVYVVPGGDSGWNMAYQSIAAPYETGPWNAERTWTVDGAPDAEAIRPACILPPVGKLGAGPCGFTYCGAAGWSEPYRGKFYMCNYTGNGGIERITLQPKGASFEITETADFLKPIQATDFEFGYDGKVYVSDFVGLEWNGGSRGGRIYTLFNPTAIATDEVRRVRELFAEGFHHRPAEELLLLLGHDDQRVRQRAQFALADRYNHSIAVGKDEATAAQLFRDLCQQLGPQNNQLTRLHALWCLGQIGRANPDISVSPFIHLTEDADAEIRGQAAKLLGEFRGVGQQTEICDALIARLGDKSPRVQWFAALSLGQLQSQDSAAALVRLAKQNANTDKYLRHAVVFALTAIDNHVLIQQMASDADPAVRMVSLLVQRNWKSPEISQFLTDSDIQLVTEAARAINDLMIDSELPKLAALSQSLLVSGKIIPNALARRILHANFRLVGKTNVESIATAVMEKQLSTSIRLEAIEALGDYARPSQRDRVTGFWRPLANRDVELVREVLEPLATSLLASTGSDLLPSLTSVFTKLDVKTDEKLFLSWVANPTFDIDSRVAALNLLASRNGPDSLGLIETAIVDERPPMRIAALTWLAKRAPEQTIARIEALLKLPMIDGFAGEHQAAVRLLGELAMPAADELLLNWMQQLIAGTVPVELQLDVLEAAQSRKTSQFDELVNRYIVDSRRPEDPLSPFRITQSGGDSIRGRQLFATHPQAQCIRCHRVGEQGGDAGPNLSRVASNADRNHLLQSLIVPSAKVAPGFGVVSVLLADGSVVAGTLKEEKKDTLELQLPDGTTRRISNDDIEERTTPVSAMPAMDKALTKRELRDLLEYLTTLK